MNKTSTIYLENGQVKQKFDVELIMQRYDKETIFIGKRHEETVYYFPKPGEYIVVQCEQQRLKID